MATGCVDLDSFWLGFGVHDIDGVADVENGHLVSWEVHDIFCLASVIVARVAKC